MKTVSLKKDTTVTIEPQNFDQITASPTEDIHLARKWIFLQRRLHHPAQSHKTATHVCHSRHNPDARSRR